MMFESYLFSVAWGLNRCRWIGLGLLLAACSAGNAASTFQAGTNQFANAPLIGPNGGLGDVTSLLACNKEVNEPVHRPGSDPAADRTAWWKWTAPADGLFVADTLLGVSQLDYLENRVIDTILAAYEGDNIAALTQVAYNDDFVSASQPSQPLRLSCLAFRAKQGVTYHIVVDGGSPGSIDASQRNVILQARFLPFEKLSRIGSFRDESNINTMGSIRYSQTNRLAFTATIQLGGKTSRHRGLLDGFGFANLVVPTSSVPGLPSTIFLDPSEDNPQALLAAHTEYPMKLPLNRVQVFTKSNPTPRAGYYTGSVKLSNDLHSFGTVRIAGNGRGTAVWRTPDNVVVTMSSQLTQGVPQRLEFYKSILRGRAALVLGMTQTVLNGVNSGGIYGAYFRSPGISGAFLPNGMQDSLSGGHFATYQGPASGNRALGFLDGSGGNGNLVLVNKNGELGMGDFLVAPGLNLGTNNRFTFPVSANRPKLVLNPRTGGVSGEITDDLGKKRRITGVLFFDRVINDLVPRIQGLATGATTTLPFVVEPL